MRLVATLMVLAAVVLAAACGPPRAPEFNATTIDGQPVASSALAGQPFLVVFWASSCSICLEEVPQFKALHRDLAPAGLGIVAVTMAYDPPGRAVDMANRLQLPYPVVLDIDGSLAAGFGGVRYTPTLVLVDGAGRISLSHVGRTDFEALRDRINILLGAS